MAISPALTATLTAEKYIPSDKLWSNPRLELRLCEPELLETDEYFRRIFWNGVVNTVVSSKINCQRR